MLLSDRERRILHFVNLEDDKLDFISLISLQLEKIKHHPLRCQAAVSTKVGDVVGAAFDVRLHRSGWINGECRFRSGRKAQKKMRASGMRRNCQSTNSSKLPAHYYTKGKSRDKRESSAHLTSDAPIPTRSDFLSHGRS